MIRIFFAAALMLGGIMLIVKVRGAKVSAPPSHAQASAPALQNKSTVTSDLTEDLGLVAEPTGEASIEAATSLAAIEYFTRNQRLSSLEEMFANENLPAAVKAALIDSALELDDPQLISRAETLALKMLGGGGAAEVLAVLPKVPQFPENSRVREIPQESLCRFSGFGFEVLKLKYDRTFPNGRPWDAVCKTS